MKALALAILALAIYAGTVALSADSLRQGATRILVQHLEKIS